MSTYWNVADYAQSIPGITSPASGGGGGGVIAYVQEVGHLITNNPGASMSVPVTNAPGAGNLLVLAVSFYDAAGTTTITVSDSKGNTWSVDETADFTGYGVVSIVSTVQDVGKLTTSDTITVTFSASVSHNANGVCHEFSGATNTVDQTAAGPTGGSHARDAGTTAATTNADDLVYAAWWVYAAETGFTAGTGYTAPSPGYYAGGTNASIEFEYQIVSATGAYNPTGTGGNATNNVGATAVYKAAAAAPTNTAAPAVSGTTVVGDTLTTTDGTWTGAPTSYAYQWQRDNLGGGNYADIPGATADTYVPVTADESCNVRCVVTATNAGGSTPADSNGVGPILAPSTGGHGIHSRSWWPRWRARGWS